MTTYKTRDEAVAVVGEEAIRKVEAVGCEPTNRVGINGLCQGDDLLEYVAHITLEDGSSLAAYYYVSNEDEQIMGNADGDGSSISWDVDHYTHD